jgi:hypothetical protein
MALGLVGLLLYGLIFSNIAWAGPTYAANAIPFYFLIGLLILPPFTAWMTGFSLRRIEDAKILKQWRVIFIRALIIATCLQSVLAIIYGIYYHIELEKIFGIFRRAAEYGTTYSGSIPNAFKNMVIASGVMWVALIAPFCAAGVSLFHRMTKFPVDRTVFDV